MNGHCGACGKTNCDGCRCSWCENPGADYLTKDKFGRDEWLCKACVDVAVADQGRKIEEIK